MAIIRQRSSDAARTAVETAQAAMAAAEAATATVADLGERVRAFEASAAQAAKDCDERRSPVATIERARLQHDEIQPLCRDVEERCRTARDAAAGAAAARDVADERQGEVRASLGNVEKSVAAAENVPNRNERVINSLHAELAATAEAVAEVGRDAERAAAAAAEAVQASVAADRAGVIAEELAKRAAVARDRLDVAQRRLAAAKAAFGDLKTRLGGRSHRPDEGIDGRIGDAQTRVLCALGDAVVEPQLPDETPPGSPFRLRCVPAAIADSWQLVAEPLDGGEAVTLGTATVSPERTFAVSVAARDDHNAVARDALATAVVRLDNPLDAGATTYVQVCRPVEAGPLVLDKFFTGRPRDKRREYPYFPEGYSCDVAIPATPWFTRLGIMGHCSGVVGEVAAAGGVRRHAAPGEKREPTTAGGRPLTMSWSWQGERFLETDIVVQTSEDVDGGIDVRLGAARLLEPWDSPRRLGFLWEPVKAGARKPAFNGLPTSDELDAQTVKVAAATIQTMAARVVADLRKQVPTLPDKAAATVVAAIKGGDDRLSLDVWAARLRQALSTSPGFNRWVEFHDDSRQRGYYSSRPRQLTPADVREKLEAYSAELLGQRDVAEDERIEVLLCRLIAELQAAQAEKEQVRQLVEEIGDGAAMLVGDLVATFPSAGGRCVLASFSRGRPEVRRKPPAEGTDAATCVPGPTTIVRH